MSELMEIAHECEVVLIEKRSRFIARLFQVEGVAAATELIHKIKSQEKSANHNCHAYRIMNGTTVIESRSDDGEPAGTAGAPMLSVLAGSNVVNTLAVVTRYFGGTKLGTGGLVRIYGESVKKALESAQLVPYIVRDHLVATFRINDTGKVNYVFEKNNIIIREREFEEVVRYHIEVTKEEKEVICRELSEIISLH